MKDLKSLNSNILNIVAVFEGGVMDTQAFWADISK